MRVDMIGPVLRIVLEHEHDRVLPERTLDSASMILPSARSLSAMYACGVGLPARAPAVWSFGSRTISSAGMCPLGRTR